MTAPREPMFLERRTYRRRRLIDAARMVPVLGVLLFLLPVLHLSGRSASTFHASLYLFGVWAVLIVFAAVLSRRLMAPESEPGLDDTDGQE